MNRPADRRQPAATTALWRAAGSRTVDRRPDMLAIVLVILALITLTERLSDAIRSRILA